MVCVREIAHHREAASAFFAFASSRQDLASWTAIATMSLVMLPFTSIKSASEGAE